MTPSKRAKESGLDNFLVRPVQAEQVHRMLAIHIIKEEVPFIKVECPALRKVFAIAGVQLKGEKAFRTTYLNRGLVKHHGRGSHGLEAKGLPESTAFRS
eukprot:1162015-Pelagomonas_calceolata.AAC.7